MDKPTRDERSQRQAIDPTKINIFMQLVRELWIPTVAAAVWAAFGTFVGNAEPTWKEASTLFTTSWVGLGWAAAQYYRVQKQLRHESKQDNLTRWVAEIRETILAADEGERPALAPIVGEVTAAISRPRMQATGTVGPFSVNAVRPPPNVQTPPQAGEAFERTLLSQADAAASAGEPRTAITLAGAAIDQSLRRLAEALPVPVGRTDSVPVMLGKLAPYLDPELGRAVQRTWELGGLSSDGVARDRELEFVAAAQLMSLGRYVVGKLQSATANRLAKVTGIRCFRCGNPTMGSGRAANHCGICGALSDDD